MKECFADVLTANYTQFNSNHQAAVHFRFFATFFIYLEIT